jgi:hypothetical protein
MSPFAMALALMPISFFFLYLGSRLLGRLKYLSWRNVTLTFYGAISLSLLAIVVGHLHSLGQLAMLLPVWLALAVPAATAGYVWSIAAGLPYSTGRQGKPE